MRLQKGGLASAYYGLTVSWNVGTGIYEKVLRKWQENVAAEGYFDTGSVGVSFLLPFRFLHLSLRLTAVL